MRNKMHTMGQNFGIYRLETQLAHKVTGHVYLAHTLADPQQQVVIKQLELFDFRHWQNEGAFLTTVARIKDLKHPFILPIYDFAVENYWPYSVTAYAPNGSLRDRLGTPSHTQFLLSEALKIVARVGTALAYAHAHGIVHGNIKPENIMFNAANEAQLADFNLAILFRDLPIAGQPDKVEMHYMAPEQFNSIPNQASDQYALACLAYELFTGQTPFTALALSTISHKHATEPPRPLTEINPNLPEQINAAVLQALAKDPAARFADVASFIAALSSPAAALLLPATILDETAITTHAKILVEAETDEFESKASILQAAQQAIILPDTYALVSRQQTTHAHWPLPAKKPSQRVLWSVLIVAVLIIFSTGIALQIFTPPNMLQPAKHTLPHAPTTAITTGANMQMQTALTTITPQVTQTIQTKPVQKATPMPTKLVPIMPTPTNPPTVTITGGNLPPPWQTQDVGAVGQAGSTTYINGTLTMMASSNNIYAGNDSFRFTYQTLNGDGSIVAHIVSAQNTNQWTRAAVMVRNSLNPADSMAALNITPGQGVNFQWRASSHGGTSQAGGPFVNIPYWLKLVRQGNIVSGYASNNGNYWTLINVQAVRLGQTSFIGIALTAYNNNNTLTTAIFDHINISVGEQSLQFVPPEHFHHGEERDR